MMSKSPQAAVRLEVGQWGLLCGVDGRQIVAVDSIPLGPSSTRKIMAATPRRLLLDGGALAEASRTSQNLVRYEGQWRIEVRPLLSPLTGSVVGMLAGVFDRDQSAPAPPLVGQWEWEITYDGHSWPTSHRRTCWDRNLFSIYEVEPRTARASGGYWEADVWVNELIDRGDQMRVNSAFRNIIQDALAGETDEFRCLSYNIVTGFGTGEQATGSKHLRLVGRVPRVRDGDERIVIQGFSYEVPGDFHDEVFGRDRSPLRVNEVLHSVMQLVGRPMAVLDVATLDVLMTSASWRREDFGSVKGFAEVVTDEDGSLAPFIRDAAGDLANEHVKDVELQRSDGTLQSARLVAVGVAPTPQGQDLVVRLEY
jgi:hypothetical protein